MMEALPFVLLFVIVAVLLIILLVNLWEWIRPAVSGDPKVLGAHVQVQKSPSDSYRIDPFRPSVLDYQRKFEDELTKLLNRLVHYCQDKCPHIPFNFQDTQGHQCTPAVGMEQGDFDLYWLVKHIEYNAARYARVISVQQDYIVEKCQKLREFRNELAHKKHLQFSTKWDPNSIPGRANNQRTREYTRELFKTGLAFADKISEGLPSRSEHVTQVKIYLGNLRGIQNSFEEFVQYLDREKAARSNYDWLSNQKKKRLTLAVLKKIETEIERRPDQCKELQELVGTVFAPRCKLESKITP